MSRSELPEGVSPTNDKSSFATPETVTPVFAPKSRGARRQNPIEAQQDFVEQVFDEDNDGGANRAAKSQPNAMKIMIVLAGLLSALAVIIIANGRSPMPHCSEQPEWNQHNCRKG